MENNMSYLYFMGFVITAIVLGRPSNVPDSNNSPLTALALAAAWPITWIGAAVGIIGS
jgi:hypothetical protein